MEGLSGLDEIIAFDAFRFELDPDKNPGVPPRVPKLLEIQGGAAILFALPRKGTLIWCRRSRSSTTRASGRRTG